MRKKVYLGAVVGVVLLVVFWNGRAQQAGVPDFSGE
jgi:hypothetical protein